jgi:hypothetical protein
VVYQLWSPIIVYIQIASEPSSYEVRTGLHFRIPHSYRLILIPISHFCLSLAVGPIRFGFPSDVWNRVYFFTNSCTKLKQNKTCSKFTYVSTCFGLPKKPGRTMLLGGTRNTVFQSVSIHIQPNACR